MSEEKRLATQKEMQSGLDDLIPHYGNWAMNIAILARHSGTEQQKASFRGWLEHALYALDNDLKEGGSDAKR